MSDQTLEERMREQLDGAKRNGVENLGPLYSLTDEVGALQREHHELCATPYAERVRENVAMRENAAGYEAIIAKLQAELGHEQNANKALWDVLTARIKKLEKALKATTEALGDHYCGVCGNAGDGEDQPYHTATEAQTCDGCRGNWQAYRTGKDLLDA